MQVPASTKIRFTWVAHIDNDRLIRRRDFIIATKSDFARAADARIELRQRARELFAIEAELIQREALAIDDAH